MGGTEGRDGERGGAVTGIERQWKVEKGTGRQWKVEKDGGRQWERKTGIKS